MGKRKLTKEEIKGPDVFIATSDKIIGWLEKHYKLILGIVLVTVLGGGGYVGYDSWQTSVERTNQEALFIIEAAQKEAAKNLQTAQENKKADTLEQQSEATLPDEYAPVVDQYITFIKGHKNSKAAAMAVVNLVSLYHEFNLDGEAEKTLVEISKSYKRDDFFFGILQLQLAKVKMNLNKYEEAIGSLQQIASSERLKFLHAETLLSLGLSYKHLNQESKAIEYFEKVGKDFDDSPSAQTAKSYLRLMYLKGQKG